VKPRVLVLRAAGTNCDRETAFAFERYGADATRVHVNRLIEGSVKLADFDALALPGGFSYGDDVSAGRVLAIELQHHLQDAILALVDRGGLVLGICNGFQVLVKMGILPGVARRVGAQDVTLTDNSSNKYEDHWVHTESVTERSVFLPEGVRLHLPLAHAEGRYVPKDDALHRRLVEDGHVAFRYVTVDGGKPAYPDNPNGSVDDVAGLIDTTGRVLGLMPHPERALFAVHHPDWTSRRMSHDAGSREEATGDGAILFENAVAALR